MRRIALRRGAAEEHASYDQFADGSAVYRDDDDGYDGEYDEYDDEDAEAYSDEYDVPDRRALARRPDELAPAAYEEPGVELTLIPCTGVSTGIPYIKRRARPLTMRLATLMLIIAVVVTGLVSITPLGAAAQPGFSSFAALSGAVVLTNDKRDYFWYTARLNDTIEQVAAMFHVQVGGILLLNGLCPSQGLELGKPFKIPTNSQYGADYESHVLAACAALAPAAFSGLPR